MARRVPRVFEGTPTLNAEKVEAIKSWHAFCLGDADKASTLEDAEYHEGSADALESVLALLYED